MSRIAPLLAARRRRYGARGVPGATRSSGLDTLNDGQNVMVEVLIDGLWRNFSAEGFVMASDRVDITHGTSSQGSVSDPARCQFRLKNHETLNWPFSEGNVLSEFWGKFGRNTQVRVSTPSGFGKSYRFQGEISEIDEEADISGEDATVLVYAVGILDRLGRGDKPLRSALFREITTPDPLGIRTLPVAYWPMEDNEGSDRLANAVDLGREMFFNGDPALRNYDDFACSEAVPNISGTKFWASVKPYSFPGSVAGPRATSVWFLLHADAITTNHVLIRVGTASHDFEVSYVATDSVRLKITANDGSGVLFDSGTVAVPAGILNKNSWFCLHIQDISNQQIYALNHQNMESDTLQGLLSHNASGPSTGPVRKVNVNPNGIAAPGEGVHIGHVAVFKHLQTDDNVANGYVATDSALRGFAGERTDVRFDRLCREEEIPHEVINALTPHPFVANTYVGVGQFMGIQKSATLLELLRECEATDGGMLYEMTSGFGLGFRTLASITSQDPAVTFTQSNNELSAQPQAKRDNNFNINEMTIDRVGGSSSTYVDDFSSMSVLPPPAGVGRYNNQTSLSLFTDQQTAEQAGWAVHKGTWPEPRFDEISIELARSVFIGGTLRSRALGVRQGDRLDITGLPARIGYNDLALLALGRSEKLDRFTHSIRWNTAPEKPYRTVVLNDDDYDRIDMDDSHLVNPVSTTDTLLLVNSLDGTRWANTIDYSAEFPFSIMINGERMTVTAGYGAVGDTFTRSVTDDWGTADAGGTWTNAGGTAANYDVNGSAGTHTMTSVNVSRRSTIPSPGNDLDMYVSMSNDQLSTGASQSGGLMARVTDSNNMYIARLEFTTTNTIDLTIQKRDGGVQTDLVNFTTSLTHVAGTSYRIRFQIEGSSLRAKAWQVGDAEPLAWQAQATDTALSGGPDVGIRSILFTGNTNVTPVTSYDNLFVTTVADNRQTLAVTRSVNGVVRSHDNGSDVHLFQPVFLAL